jgi:hypothetical protein
MESRHRDIENAPGFTLSGTRYERVNTRDVVELQRAGILVREMNCAVACCCIPSKGLARTVEAADFRWPETPGVSPIRTRRLSPLARIRANLIKAR